MSHATPRMLGGLRAVDMTGLDGSFVGRILASLGVDVIKVEPPGGDPSRIDLASGAATSLAWRAANADKRSVTLDLTARAGRRQFMRLTAQSDFVLESSRPGTLTSLGLDAVSLIEAKPSLIVTSISPFGQHGPYSSFTGGELVISAMGGVAAITGDPDRPPVREGPDSIRYIANLAAFAATMVAHHHRAVTGRGQHVDVSQQHVVAARGQHTLIMWDVDRTHVALRGGGERSTPMAGVSFANINSIVPCRDGYVFWNMSPRKMGARANRAIVRWMLDDGMQTPLAGVDDWDEFQPSQLDRDQAAEFDRSIREFFARHTKQELRDEGGRRGLNASPVNTVAEVLADPQLAARGFWAELDSDEHSEALRYPAHVLLSDVSETRVSRRAPHPGEHNVEIADELGLAADESPEPSSGQDGPPSAPNVRAAQTHGDAPARALSGLKVLDFGWALIGALTTKCLADHGATVIRVESSTRPDLTRMVGFTAGSMTRNFDDKPWFGYVSSSKQSLALDLKHPRAAAVVDRLVDWADVVNENFRPGTLEKLGFGYEYFRARKPSIVMTSSSAYGQTGPMATSAGVDGTAAALSGYRDLTGWSDRPPATPALPFGDVAVPYAGAGATLAAVEHARRTGQGQHLDLAMLEICVHQVSAELLQYQATGEVAARNGNRVRDAAPHGIFACRDGGWIAIAVSSDTQWKALGEVAGAPNWAVDTRFATLSARKLHEDELELAVGGWTADRDAHQLMSALQAAGVAAGVVQDAPELLDTDPQLRARGGLLTQLDHPVIGVHGLPQPPFRLSLTPASVTRAPLFGEHTEQVCTGLLGFSDAEYANLVEERVLS